MKKLLALSVLSIGLFTTGAYANAVITATGGTAAATTSASNHAKSEGLGLEVRYDDDLYGHIDGQSPDDRLELIASSGEGECKATFTKTINRGDEVTVLKTSHEPGGIMERYYIKEQGGRWYYASHFSGIRCN